MKPHLILITAALEECRLAMLGRKVCTANFSGLLEVLAGPEVPAEAFGISRPKQLAAYPKSVLLMQRCGHVLPVFSLPPTKNFILNDAGDYNAHTM